MATIAVSVSGYNGDVDIAGYVGQLAAISVRDTVSAGVGSSKAELSEIYLTRYRDGASPKLAQDCSTGKGIGEVTVTVFRSVAGTSLPFFSYKLETTYISRIEYDTVEVNGIAHLPHYGYSNQGAPYWGAAVRSMGASVNDFRVDARARAAASPVFSEPRGAFTNFEVERVWLNAAKITWKHTPYDAAGIAGAVIEKGWNLSTGAAI